MRDVFTMGARPIANLNSIHFGSTQHKKTKNLLRGVVKGIGGYGNCIGVPTIAGQTCFDQSYNGNILVNAMTLGFCLLYTSPSPRDLSTSRMPSSA